MLSEERERKFYVDFYLFAGELASHIFGWIFSFEVMNFIILMLCVGFVGLMSFLKETPVYLLSRGQHQEAVKSLKFYRGALKSADVVEEMAYIWIQTYPNVTQKDVQMSNEIFEKLKLTEIYNEKAKIIEENPWKILWSTISMRRATVTITLHLVVVSFMAAIVKHSFKQFLIAVAPTYSLRCSIALSSTIFLGCGVFWVICDMIGRRPLMMMSSVASTMCLTAIAFTLKYPWAPAWVVPALVLLFSLSFYSGAANVPFVQLGETFVFEVKSAALVTAISAVWLTKVMAAVVFCPTVEFLGWNGTFLVLSVLAALTAIVSYFFMKETRGIPVECIQNMYEQDCLYSCRIHTRHST